MFCIDCGELIQRHSEKVRINDMLVHVWCAVSFVHRLFSESQGEGQLTEAEGQYPCVVESHAEINVVH